MRAGSNCGILGPLEKGEQAGGVQVVLHLIDELGVGDNGGYGGGLGRRACGGGIEQRFAGATKAGGRLIGGKRNASQQSSAFGAQRVCSRHGDCVALQFNIEIVFECEGDGVLQGQVDLTGADQIAEARGIVRIGTRNGARFIDAQRA